MSHLRDAQLEPVVKLPDIGRCAGLAAVETAVQEHGEAEQDLRALQAIQGQAKSVKQAIVSELEIKAAEFASETSANLHRLAQE